LSLPVVYTLKTTASDAQSQCRRAPFPVASQASRGLRHRLSDRHCHHLYEVRAKVAEALERAHETSRPTVLELITYRYRGHSIADANAEKYRPKEEILEYQRTKDPIHLFETLLTQDGLLTESSIAEINDAAKAEAQAAAEFAQNSPWPTEESITEDVYWTSDNPGKHETMQNLLSRDWPRNKD
jgi:pyruvate dehydrogenase E1 component alpha subunit